MAERRMFAKTIVLSDEFLDMPTSTRCLYFTLGMFADDEGFVNNPKSIIRQIGASVDDMNILVAKKFVITFKDGVIVIKHWRIHNYIQNDRKKETKYLTDKETLFLDENKAYTQNKEHAKYLLDGTEIDNASEMDTTCIQSVSIGKDSIGKDSIGKKVRKEKDNNIYKPARESYDDIMNEFSVSEILREHLFKFIAHLNANGIKVINDRLESLIISLDMTYKNDEVAKIREIQDAIQGGYKQLKCERR